MSKTNKGKKRVTFTFSGSSKKSVFLAGAFNHWDTTKHRLKPQPKSDVYSITLLLSPGRYEYKFLVDGTWCVDPSNSHWVLNDMGTMNSVIEV